MLSDADDMKQNKDDLFASGWFNFGQELSITKRGRQRNEGLWHQLWWKLSVAKEQICFFSSPLPSELRVHLHLSVSSSYPIISPQDPLFFSILSSYEVCKGNYSFSVYQGPSGWCRKALTKGDEMATDIRHLGSPGCGTLSIFVKLQCGQCSELGAVLQT